MFAIPFQIAFALVATISSGDYPADTATFGDTDLIAISKELLDPERQIKFAALHDSYAREQQAYRNAVQGAGEADPLFRQAMDSKLQASRNHMEAKKRLDAYEGERAKEYPDSVADYEKWRDAYGRLYEETGASLADAAADPHTRALTLWFCHLMLARPIDEQPKSIRKFLPPNTTDLTPDAAFELLLEISRKRNLDELRHEVDALEQKLSYLKMPRRAVEAVRNADALCSGYSEYIFINKPAYVKQSEKRMQQLQNEMVTVWPECWDVHQHLVQEAARRKKEREQQEQKRNAPIIPST